MIGGIVLAAGRSRRMGTPKALLVAGDETFLERITRGLREGGCSPVLVVVADAAGPIAATARLGGAGVVVNGAPSSEQIESLRCGLRALPVDVAAAVVTPVDIPDVPAALVRGLIAAFRAGDPPVVVPRADGRDGHPVLFARRVFAELEEPGLREGAREVMLRHRARTVGVPVERLPMDLDTPEAYLRWRDAGATGDA
jgi:CTP:molybdopterin cytidylyltransferase MocA